jgi:energy-coupling factor transporter ATP-binding protein EcfA2
VLWDLLGRLDDARLRRGLFDPFTSASSFSRGERQRLAICLALTRVRRNPDCTLLFDEPTSAQDGNRTSALVDCIRELLPPQFAGEGSLVLAAHDPESLDALLGDRATRSVTDHVLWLEDGRAHEFTVHAAPGKGQRWEGATAQPHGLQGYLADMTTLLEAREATPDLDAVRVPEGPDPGIRLLRSRLVIGGERYAVSPQAVVRGGELFVLRGASGSGKSTLLRRIAARRPGSIEVGYVMQDPGRAFPEEMPVREVLGDVPIDLDRVRRWFGGPVPDEMLERPVCALSEGEKQRVLFAGEVLRIERSPLHARLRLLLLDEPFGAVDPPAHLRLMDLLLEWLREGQGRSTAILVSHSPDMDLGLARASGIPVTEWTIDNGDR